MTGNWRSELIRLLAILVLVTSVAALMGLAGWGLLVALLIYTGWTFFQLNRIQFWLNTSSSDEPPESSGIWGDILDGIYHLQRHDKEEKVRLKATVDYLQDSFSSLPDAVVLIDKRGNIVWSNRSSEALLGLYYPQDEKQYILNLIRDPKFASYYENEQFEEHLEIQSHVRTHITLQIRITFFGKRNKLLFARDVTTLVQLERMRRDFVGNVSHELRTPLTVIRGYLETFQDFPVTDDKRWQSALEQMLQQTNRMDALVKDLMVLSRLETVPDSQRPEEVDVKQLTDIICNDLTAAGIGHRRVVNNVPEQAHVLGNPDELQSAFTNLLTNAVRYTDDDGTIEIFWEGMGKEMCYRVKDNGLGIADEHLPRLTERFYCVDKSRSASMGGTGLGLAIVKHILIRHNATLRISSKLGEGSTFSCCFVVA